MQYLLEEIINNFIFK